MMMMTEAPTELFVDVAPSMLTSAAGEVLGRACDLPVGPWTAVLLSEVDPVRLTDWDLPAYLTLCGRVQAWAAGLVVGGVVELTSRPGARDTADKEVALALAEPIGASQRRIFHARRLHRMLPQTWRRLRFGEISQRHAEGIVEAISGVEDAALAAEVEERALRSADQKTATELRKHARRILSRLDPAGVERRARESRQRADVTFDPGADGMALVCADLPVEDARIVKEAVDAYAITAKQSGDIRPVGVLRGEAVTGWASNYLTGGGPTGHSAAAATPRSGGRPIEVQVVVDLDTALGRKHLPAEVPGCGIVPREAVAAMVAAERAALRLLVVDAETGRLQYRGVNRYRPTPEQIAHVRAAWVTSAGPGSQVFATRCDLDHPNPYPTGATSVDELIPEDRTWHRGKTRTSLSVTIDDRGAAQWNTPLGQNRTVAPYDYLLTDADKEQPPRLLERE